eukprot:GHRR01004214.1.p1 GENE.GHRR01004214.1~~GHRR01004214.1.p1  ORF type:complete len:622 (+),score=87.26 GHRR01004214.1:393-2258(+)
MHKAFVSDEGLAAAYDEAKSKFSSMDTNGDGAITFDELKQAMQQQGFNVKDAQADDILQWQFQMCDVDGNGSITLDEALYLFYNISATLRQCRRCHCIISPLHDAGYCCTQCHNAVTAKQLPQHLVYDLCSQCYKPIQKPNCPKHGHVSMQCTDVLLEQCPLPDRAATCLLVPGANTNACSAHDVLCMSCGEHHAIVLSYLSTHVNDLHMRPVYNQDSNTGEQTLKGFVCEFCAVRICSTPSHSCMWWDTDSATPTLCTEVSYCSTKARANASAAAVNPRLDKIADVAMRRSAAHCPTCRMKLYAGTKLWSCDVSGSTKLRNGLCALANSADEGLSKSSQGSSSSAPPDNPCSVVYDLCILKNNAPKDTPISTAWVVWEPIPQLQEIHDALGNTLKHCFLLFELAKPISCYDYKYLRIERQNANVGPDGEVKQTWKGVAWVQSMLQRSQSRAASAPKATTSTEKEAALTIRLAMNRTVALYLDTRADICSSDDLYAKNAVASPDDAPYGVVYDGVFAFKQRFTLGLLLEVMEVVHKRRPNYDVTDANCVWYVKEVLRECRDGGYIAPDSIAAHDQFNQKWRIVMCVPSNVGPEMVVDIGAAVLDATAAAVRKACKVMKKWG